MKKQIILLPLLLLILTNLIFSQQLENWGITSKFVDFTPNFSVGGLPTPPNNLPGYPSDPTYYYAGQKATYHQNSYHDPNGTLLFFIVDGEVYDGAGFKIGTIPTGLNTEVLIVPSDETVNCSDYYLLYGNGNAFAYLYSKLLRLSIQNSTYFPGIPARRGELYTGETELLDAEGGSCRSFKLAMGPTNTDGTRYVYAANCSDFCKVTFNPSTGSLTFNSATTVPVIPTNFSHRGELELIKLSNGSFRAAYSYMANWGSYIKSLLITYNLNPSGDVTSYVNWDNLSAATSETIKGLEFSANGNYLYFSQNHSPYLRYIDLVANPNTVNNLSVSSAAEFRNGMIERGSDGKLYFVANNRLGSLGDSNNPSSTWSSSVSGTSLGTNFYPNTYGSIVPADSSGKALRLLLDQVDGQDYTYTFNDPNDDCCNDRLPWHEITKTLSSSPTSQMWTIGSGNPYNAGVIRIKSSLTIPSGVTLTIRSMTVEFGAGATINVGNGAHLKLENAILQTNCPKTMWQGIVVTGTGNVTMTNYSLAGSAIYDAVIGIDLSGTSAKATVNNLSYFERNETHIKINNGGTQNSFIGSVFSHQTPLKDQTKGKDQSGGTIGTRYGIKSFDLINCTNTQIIGGTPSNYGNWFYEGQHGIYAVNSNATSLRNIFNTVRNRGIFSDALWTGKTINVTTANTFNNCKTAIDGHFGTNLTVTGNAFNGGTEHAITWAYNPGRTLIVGDESSSTFQNTFTGQNWSSVMATDNANSATTISIGYNLIQNAAWSGGIYVQESSGQTSQTYQKMHIVENDINDMGDGVVVNNVWGINNALQWESQQSADPTPYTFKTNNNDIDFSTAYGSNKSGIRVSNSRFVRSRFNNISTTGSSSGWGSKGVDYSDSRYSLVEKNYCKANAGIQLYGDMRASNIDCNEMSDCVIGIELVNEILRDLPTITHGETTGLNRKNDFYNSTSSDMRLNNSYPGNNKWVEPNTTSIAYSPPPYNGNIIVSGGSDRCNLLPGYELLMGGGGEEQNNYEQEGDTEEYNYYWFESLPAEQEKWTIIYHEQAEHNANEDGITVTDNHFITAVLNLERLISENNFEVGRELWQQLNPVHPFEHNLKDVYGVLLAYRPEEPRKLTEDEITTLAKVAEQNVLQAGPAVYSARAILKYKENLEFYDVTEGPIMPYESGKTDETTDVVDLRFAAYPVPTKDMLTLLSGIEGVTYYKIVSIDGRIVETGSFASHYVYNTQRLVAGSYYLEMADQAGNILYRKLISKQ